MTDDGVWWIGHDESGYSLFWFERYVEWGEQAFADAEETIYAFFVAQTEWLAREELVRKPATDKDARVSLGRMQAELLGRASPAWRQRRQQEVAAEIAAHPYTEPPHPFANDAFYYVSPQCQNVTGTAKRN